MDLTAEHRPALDAGSSDGVRYQVLLRAIEEHPMSATTLQNKVDQIVSSGHFSTAQATQTLAKGEGTPVGRHLDQYEMVVLKDFQTKIASASLGADPAALQMLKDKIGEGVYDGFLPKVLGAAIGFFFANIIGGVIGFFIGKSIADAD